MKLNLTKQDKWALVIILINFALLSVISYFRYAVFDEKLYLHETIMMSEILKQGEWIGNYGVGLHGFLFKLPVAIAFMITGASTYVATFFHIILASITCWIFYRILACNLNLKKWSLIGLILLISNYSFFSWSLTFHREIPVLFALMLFTYFIINHKEKIFLNSLLLLLILDAKEYVFFIVVPVLLIYFFIINEGEKKGIPRILSSLKPFLLLLFPSLIYLVLMFTTSIIPVNMFDASLLGLTEGHFGYQLAHTLPGKALTDLSSYSNNNIIYRVIRNVSTDIFGIVQVIPLYIASYFEKFLYISTFSFQGISLFVLIPSFISSLYIFKEWKKSKKQLLFLVLFFWVFIIVYMIRSSHQRYILPLLPFLIIFLIIGLITMTKEWSKYRKFYLVTIIISVIAFLATILYQDLTDLRVLFNIVSGFVILLLLGGLFYFKKYRKVLINLITIFIIGASLFINIYAISTKNQIYKSITWGINGEANRIAQMLSPEDVIFVDCKSGSISEFTYLINFYRKNNYLPIEWHWKLDKNLVRRKLDAVEIRPNFYYGFDVEDIVSFKSNIVEKDINKIILLKSDLENQKFPLEDYIEVFEKENWLKLVETQQMKNKTIYIFEVIDGNIEK